MTIDCSQCGRKTDDPYIIPWAIDMGPVCHPCFDEITEFPPTRSKQPLSAALQKAHEVRSQNAKTKNALKEELKKARIESNPERYQRQLAAAEKMRAARKKKNEGAPDPVAVAGKEILDSARIAVQEIQAVSVQ